MDSHATLDHVYISYAHKDQTYARKLRDSLRQRGLEVWMDEHLKSGDRWLRTIEQAVRDSAAFVVVMTPESRDSKWVEREILLAESEGKPIFPLLLRGRVFFLLINTIWDDVTNGRLPPDDFYERLEREVRARSEEEITEAPEPVVRKKRVWTWPLFGLLALVIGMVVVGVVACGLVGDGEAIKPTVPQPPSNASLGDIWTRPADGMEMVYVPGGTFEMGSTEGFDDEQPVHAVTLDSFWIDKTEVTNDQFERFVQATDYRTDAEKEGIGEVYSDGSWSEVDGADWQHPNGPETSISGRMDHPVVQVTWNDATTFCQWAGGRLPTEAEWEYAARGPDGHIYPWGNDAPDDTLLNYNEDVGDITQVGSYPSGASWVGAMDMVGNVWEWVADWYDGDYYASSPSQNPKGPETRDEMVVRGGGWSISGAGVRAASRYHPLPDDRVDALGFRCVVEPGD
jgi:formylglycine-generating enzyme required for sulfatase activity